MTHASISHRSNFQEAKFAIIITCLFLFPAAAVIQPTVGMTILDNIFPHMGKSGWFFTFKLGQNNSQSDLSVISLSITFGQLDFSIMVARMG